MRGRTFSFSDEPLEPHGVPAHVPTQMSHPRAEVAVTSRPTVIGPGMTVLPPLPADAVLDRVRHRTGAGGQRRRFRPVLISGCGHPRIEQILGSPNGSWTCPSAPWSAGCTCRSTRPGPRWCRRRCRATRTRPGSRSANATPSTCWRRYKRAVHRWWPCPGMTARRGPMTRSPAASATATAPCEREKNCDHRRGRRDRLRGRGVAPSAAPGMPDRTAPTIVVTAGIIRTANMPAGSRAGKGPTGTSSACRRRQGRLAFLHSQLSARPRFATALRAVHRRVLRGAAERSGSLHEQRAAIGGRSQPSVEISSRQACAHGRQACAQTRQ